MFCVSPRAPLAKQGSKAPVGCNVASSARETRRSLAQLRVAQRSVAVIAEDDGVVLLVAFLAQLLSTVIARDHQRVIIVTADFASLLLAVVTNECTFTADRLVTDLAEYKKLVAIFTTEAIA